MERFASGANKCDRARRYIAFSDGKACDSYAGPVQNRSQCCVEKRSCGLQLAVTREMIGLSTEEMAIKMENFMLPNSTFILFRDYDRTAYRLGQRTFSDNKTIDVTMEIFTAE